MNQINEAMRGLKQLGFLTNAQCCQHASQAQSHMASRLCDAILDGHPARGAVFVTRAAYVMGRVNKRLPVHVLTATDNEVAEALEVVVALRNQDLNACLNFDDDGVTVMVRV